MSTSISPVVTIAQSTQQGTIYGSAVAIPATAANGQAVAVMADVDVLAASPGQRTMQLGLQYSFDGGKSFATVAASSWQSGPGNVVMGGSAASPPSLGTGIPSNPIPTHVRAYISLPAMTSIGINIVFTDATGVTL